MENEILFNEDCNRRISLIIECVKDSQSLGPQQIESSRSTLMVCSNVLADKGPRRQ